MVRVIAIKNKENEDERNKSKFNKDKKMALKNTHQNRSEKAVWIICTQFLFFIEQIFLEGAVWTITIHRKWKWGDN